VLTSTPLIEISHLYKGYKSGDNNALVLNDVKFSLPAGSMAVIRGMSGSGKTTLLNVLGGLDRADSGQIRVGEWHLEQMDNAALGHYRARDVGFIFQFHNLIPTLTVLENLLTSIEPVRHPNAEDKELAMDYLEKVGLAAFAQRFPARLSGGQQQRVAIARALLKEPKLILADEPTGSLDEDTGLQVIALLQQMQQQKNVTLVIVTHNPDLSQYADSNYEMRAGRLQASGA